jgi:signal transduction histidine kinase
MTDFRHILIVEDDADTRANLRDILELDDYRVDDAASVAAALDRRDWAGFAAIVLDRNLPDGSAEELLPKLKRLAPHAAVIILTGYADLDSAIAALRLGADDYILKPVNPDALRASLFRCIEYQRAEERSRQAERLAAIGEMVAGLAHESRNALQRSQACLEMLEMEVEDRPAALDLIRRIQRAQDDLHHLYEEVREYAAPLRLLTEACDLDQVWRETWSQLESARNGKAVVLREQLDAANLSCECDPFALGQVFRNIFENAIAACDEPGEILIRCTEATLHEHPALRIAIQDNGPGIPTAIKELVFEPFFTNKTKGTGLGMAIARRIVEAHRGRIVVGDDCDSGAEFVLTLQRDAK